MVDSDRNYPDLKTISNIIFILLSCYWAVVYEIYFRMNWMKLWTMFLHNEVENRTSSYPTKYNVNSKMVHSCFWNVKLYIIISHEVHRQFKEGTSSFWRFTMSIWTLDAVVFLWGKLIHTALELVLKVTNLIELKQGIQFEWVDGVFPPHREASRKVFVYSVRISPFQWRMYQGPYELGRPILFATINIKKKKMWSLGEPSDDSPELPMAQWPKS